MKLRGHHKFNTIEFNSIVISGKTPFKGNNNINSFLSSPRKITTQLGHEHALIQLTLYCKHCGLQKSVCPFPCSLEFCQYLQSFLCTLTCFFFSLTINTTTYKKNCLTVTEFSLHLETAFLPYLLQFQVNNLCLLQKLINLCIHLCTRPFNISVQTY